MSLYSTAYRIDELVSFLSDPDVVGNVQQLRFVMRKVRDKLKIYVLKRT
jgi:hypothetical protein